MNANEIFIYALLADSIRDGRHPTLAEIAERLDLDQSTVHRCVAALREAGFVNTVRPGRRLEYRLTDRCPALFDRIRGWMYRFTASEANRRFWEATVSSRIFYKARELRGRRGDPEFILLRGELFDEYPNLCDVTAIWPVDEALSIERRLNELLDWEKRKSDQVSALAAVSSPESDDGR